MGMPPAEEEEGSNIFILYQKRKFTFQHGDSFFLSGISDDSYFKGMQVS